MNATILSLVPKKENATHMRECSPISCCTTIYKCIAKILANRLKEVLPKLISLNQAAFIEGKIISDIIILAHELVHNYHRSGISPRSAIKIDFFKGFDSLNWEFILNMLYAAGFPTRFVSWIKGCITSPWFSVAVNGSLPGFFKGRRGMRQGDLLSLYIFVMVMELLSQMMNSKAKVGLLGFHPKCKSLNLTHLSFADDLFIFTDGSETFFRSIDEFYQLSVLKLRTKKTIFLC